MAVPRRHRRSVLSDYTDKLPEPVGEVVERLLLIWERFAERTSVWWARSDRRFLVTALIATVAVLMLLSNIHLMRSPPRPTVPPTPLEFYDPVKDVHGGESIYVGRRRTPKSQNATEIRLMQERAFDPLDPVFLKKSDLEIMVGRSLPLTTETSLGHLNYGSDKEVSEDRRWNRVLYFVTPTYRRDTQMIDLTRMSQTLQAAAYTQMGIIYWIIIEDSDRPTQRIRWLLERSGLPFAHLARESDPTSAGHGMLQRNAGIETAREVGADGVIYFADDDNSYDIDLVTELTRTKSVSAFGVGLVGNGSYERCHVGEDGKVDRLISGYLADRKFPIDMAGFAFATAWDAHLNFTAGFDNDWEGGSFESHFLEKLIPEPTDFQPLAGGCTRMLAWHTRTQLVNAGIWEMEGDPDWSLISTLL